MSHLHIKADSARIAALVLSAMTLLFSVFAVILNEYGFHVEFYLSAMPAYNGGSLSSLMSVLPGIVLLVGMLMFDGDERKLLAVVASGIQLLALVMYYMGTCDSLGDFIAYLPQMLSFSIYPLAIISFGVALFALLKRKDATSILFAVGIGLTVIALFLTLSGTAPFGNSSWYYDTNEYYLNTFLHFSSSWLALPMVFASVDAASKQTVPSHAAKTRSDAATQIVESQTLADNMNLIKQLKELLDSGAITQEEFDRKKKELLKL